MKIGGKRIKRNLLNEEQIDEITWKNAFDLVKDIDEKDTVYIAFSLFFESKLWSGDQKLIKGLKAKNKNLTMTTSDLLKL